MTQPTPLDEFQIYMAWPEETIVQQLNEFKNGENGMYNGAGPEQLSAGLHCLDFLTRASEMSDTTRMMIDAAVTEAETRIALMLQMEDRKLQDNELYDKIETVLKNIQAQLRVIMTRAQCVDHEQVLAFIRRRREAQTQDGRQ